MQHKAQNKISRHKVNIILNKVSNKVNNVENTVPNKIIENNVLNKIINNVENIVASEKYISPHDMDTPHPPPQRERTQKRPNCTLDRT